MKKFIYSKKLNYSKKVFASLFTVLFTGSLIFPVFALPQEAAACAPTTYSISGKKFNDLNGNGIKDCVEPFLSGWVITIEGPNQFSDSKITNQLGSYSFSGLLPGLYTVCEVQQTGWQQTAPNENSGCYIINLYQNFTNKNFGNKEILPYCGDGTVNGQEICDEGQNNGTECTPAYGSSCTYCSETCQEVELTGPYCGDGNVEQGYEECEEDADCSEGEFCSACFCEEEPYCELELTKTDNVDPVNPGDEIIYSVTLKNTGTADCTGTGVRVKDVFDQNTTYVSSNRTPETIASDYIKWNVGTLHPGDEVDIDLTVLVSEETECGTVLINKVKYWSNQTDWSEYVIEETTVECPPAECGDGNLDPGEECDDGNTEDGDGCSVNCTIEKTTIKAYKVVCESEEDLPNWGDGSGPSQITANTAIDYITDNPACWLESDWDFQWGFNGEVSSPNGNDIGPGGTGWNDFDSSTGTSTPAEVEIADLEGTSQIWVKENLKENYIPFAGPPGDLQNDVSAEMYCYDDILDYDNYDYIINPVLENTYYCVAFNAPVPGPECGNGVKEGDEECDGTDGVPEYYTCTDQCTLEYVPYCGDGNLDPGEECDDGNLTDGDGCSANCTIELVCNPEEELAVNGGFEIPVVTHDKKWNIFTDVTGWTTEWNTPEPSYGGLDRPVDAYLEFQRGVNGWFPQEEFQYAELDSDWDGPDGSVSGEPASVQIYQDITTIPGETYSVSFWFSPRPNTTESNNQLGFSWAGVNQPTISVAGGSANNWTNHNYLFVATGNTARIQFANLGTSDALGTFLDNVSVRCQLPEPYCGDGNKDPGEECDDGNTEDGDGCSATCTIEEIEEPVTILANKVVCQTEADLPNWGTTGTQKPLEINSNTAQSYVDGSGGKCSLAEGWDFQWGLDGEAINDFYGNHIGPAPAGKGWNNFDSSTGTSTPAEVEITDLKATSGIWVRENLQAGYIPFANPPGALQDSGSAEIYCYEDILNYDNYDYIQSPEYGIIYYCIALNALTPGPYCGDGEKDDKEDCDEGQNNGAVCDPEYDSSCSYCSLECEIIKIDGPYCGDGELNDPYEQCDDGNIEDGDGCSAICTTEENGPVCGNGILEGNELCDDGNTVSGDGCSANCIPEGGPNFYCGDGILFPGEECDDGNKINGDGCSSNCTLEKGNGPYCGNGILETGEECDGETGVLEGYTCAVNCVLEKTECNIDLDVMVVMDVSGSMGTDSPTRLSQAQIAANGLLDYLRSKDQSGLVSFSWTASLDKTLSNDHASTQSIINNLTAGGATNIGDAINMANGELMSANANPQALKVEILLTDGRANQPSGDGSVENPVDVALAIAKSLEAADNGIIVFTVGLGSSINTTMLQNIADNTGGQYYAAPTSNDLERIFNQIAFEMCQYEPGAELPTLTIFNQKVEATSETSVTVSWYTNIPATSQVVYGEQPVLSPGSPPNYGYPYSTPETNTIDKVIFHVVTINDLIPNTIYYWRPISQGSTALGEEMSFTISEEQLACKGEGETIPVIANPPECCLGLELIPPKEEGIVGISGICTAKCGNEICDSETESSYNCPQDCFIVEEIIVEGIEEETIVEAEKEEEGGFGRFLAAIGGFFGSVNFYWLFFLLIIVLTILFLFTLTRRKKLERKKQWIWFISLVILIILYCIFCCANCSWLLIVLAGLIFLFLLFRKDLEKKLRKPVSME